MFKNILVPTDGSELSQGAVQNAVEFAKETDAKITIFFARPEYHSSYSNVEGTLVGPKIMMEHFEKASREQAMEALGFAESLCRKAGVPYEKKTLASDSPYEAIIEAANQCGCDLIFMASHGRKGISGLLLGSETQKVLTHSSIPVLVYRQAEST